MKRIAKSKDAAHLQRKLSLYENFLFRYLPQISSVSNISRLNIFDMAGKNGLNKLGTQGSPFIIFKALQKQRQHQLKNKFALKPFSLSLVNLREQKSFNKAAHLLSEQNIKSNTCRLESISCQFSEGVRKVLSQIRQQAGTEKNLLLMDLAGAEDISLHDLKLLAGRKAEVVLYLPLKALWMLHTKAGKAPEPEDICLLKESLDGLFPHNHSYWQEEVSQEDFFHYIKDVFRLQGDFFTAMEPTGPELPEGALLVLSSDAYMMEKVLLSLQSLRHENATPPGEQIPLFGSGKKNATEDHNATVIPNLLKEDQSNQQLYLAGLQAGIHPLQLLSSLHDLFRQGQIEIHDLKGKPTNGFPPNCISYSAGKAAEPVCFFRRKDL